MRSVTRWDQRWRWPALVVVGAWSASCTPPPSANFEDPLPASRLLAIESAARTGDRSAIPHLIDSLESADPAVRLFAFQTLVAMTGEECGYRVGDPPERRATAVARWAELARERGWVHEEPPS